MTPTPLLYVPRIANYAQTSEISVAVALDSCHDALDSLPMTGTVTVTREALTNVLEHHAALAASVDTLRRAIAQRELDDERAPICAPCKRIEKVRG